MTITPAVTAPPPLGPMLGLLAFAMLNALPEPDEGVASGIASTGTRVATAGSAATVPVALALGDAS